MLKKFPMEPIIDAFQGKYHYFELEEAFKRLVGWTDKKGIRYLLYHHPNPIEMSIVWGFKVKLPETAVEILFEEGMFLEEEEEFVLRKVKKKTELTNVAINKINSIIERGKWLMIPEIDAKVPMVRAMRGLEEYVGSPLEKTTKLQTGDVFEVLGAMTLELAKGVKLWFDIIEFPMVDWSISKAVVTFDSVGFSFSIFKCDFQPSKTITALEAKNMISEIFSRGRSNVEHWNGKRHGGGSH